MKVYINEEENNYLHRLIVASAAFYHPYVQAFQILSSISKKTTPPRAYINLDQNEKMNIAGLVNKTVEAINAQIEKAGEDETKKIELNKQKDLLKAILTKMDLAVGDVVI